MSARSKCDVEEQPEDGDLGLGHGCQPGGLPPFEILHRSWPSYAEREQRPFEASAFQDSDGIQNVKRSTNPLMKLTSKLGFYSKPKHVSQADDSTEELRESDTVALSTSLKQAKLMFQRHMMDIQQRRNVDMQQLGAPGIVCY